MKRIKVTIIISIVLILVFIFIARMTAPNRFFTIVDIAPSTLKAELSLMVSIIEDSEEKTGDYPLAIESLIPRHALALSKPFCDNNLRYKYPGTHNLNGYDLWFEPCEKLQTELVSNWE